MVRSAQAQHALDMKIAMFGGTGAVGTPLLSQTLAAGHEVRLLARNVSAAPAHARLTTVCGDARDASDTATVVRGCDAVLSTLGGYGDADAIDLGTANIITAMRSTGVGRIVLLQGFHLPFPDDPHGIGPVLVNGFLRLADRDLVPRSRVMARAIQRVEDIDWTLVRIPRVVPGDATGRTQMGRLGLGPWSKVTSGDAAATMLAVLPDRSTTHSAPMVETLGRHTRVPRDARGRIAGHTTV